MRIMVLGATDAAVDLALQLAESRGITPISAAGRLSQGDDAQPDPGLEQELEGECVLRDGPETPEHAAALDSLLDALSAPLDLVIGIDAGREDPATPSPGGNPLWDYYRERGLLRLIRCEGEAAQLLAAAERIVADLVQARRREGADPFTAALQALAREELPTAEDAVEPDTAETPAEAPAAEEPPRPSAEAVRPTPSWKRTAAQKGRLRRQPAGRKEGKKTRR